MYYLWLKCGCGAESDRSVSLDVMRLSRKDILARARCSQCNVRNAVDMRRYWNPGANALDGAREIGEGLAEW